MKHAFPERPLVTLLLGLLSLAPSGARSAPFEPRGFLLQIIDPDRDLKGPPSVHLTNPQGYDVTVRPTDDGQAPDVRSKDGTYAASVPNRPTSDIKVQVTDGASKWMGEVAISQSNAELLVRLKILDGGRLSVEDTSESTAAAPGAGVMQERTGPSVSFGLETLPWLLAGLAVVGAVGLLAWRSAWRRPPPARLCAHTLETVYKPLRLNPEHVSPLLLGPLATRRVVTLASEGQAPEGTFSCEERGPLVEELIAAVERLAATDGAPVALLVLDPALLDVPRRGSRSESLAKMVAGRFPLYIVGGPESWERWTPEEAQPDQRT